MFENNLWPCRNSFIFPVLISLCAGRISNIIVCRHFDPRQSTTRIFEADELLLDSTQKPIFSLIFFWKLHFLLQYLFSHCPLNKILCSSSNIGRHREGRIGCWVSLCKLESIMQCPSWRTEGRECIPLDEIFDSTLGHVTTEGKIINCN